MNTLKLKAAMILQKKTADQICAEVGISHTAWWRKTCGKSQFTQSEIAKLRKILNLDADQTIEIFFTPEVS